MGRIKKKRKEKEKRKKRRRERKEREEEEIGESFSVGDRLARKKKHIINYELVIP